MFWLPYCHTLWHHQYLICIIQKLWISLERYEVWQTWKHHSSSLLKAFQIHLFFNTSIFHFIGTLRNQIKIVAVVVESGWCKSIEVSSILLAILASIHTESRRVIVLTKLLIHGAQGTSWKDLYWIKVLSDLYRNIEGSKLCSDQLILSKKGHWNFKEQNKTATYFFSVF